MVVMMAVVGNSEPSTYSNEWNFNFSVIVSETSINFLAVKYIFPDTLRVRPLLFLRKH